jgi:predicted transcriptional regulator
LIVLVGERRDMETRLRKRERDRIAIVAEILDMARYGVLKSNIMWRARLSYEMLNDYLGLMVKSKLVEKVLMNNRVVFKPTDKGIKFLYHCQEIKALLDGEDERSESYRRILLPSTVSQAR